MKPETLREIQRVLAEENLDAWFFACFRDSDPVAPRILGLPEGFFLTRRWFCVIPRTGDPVTVLPVTPVTAASPAYVPGAVHMNVAGGATWRTDYELVLERVAA